MPGQIVIPDTVLTGDTVAIPTIRHSVDSIEDTKRLHLWKSLAQNTPRNHCSDRLNDFLHHRSACSGSALPYVSDYILNLVHLADESSLYRAPSVVS